MRRQGQGTRDSPYNDKLTLSYVLSSMSPGLCIPSTNTVVLPSCNSLFLNRQSFSLFPFSSLIRMTLSPCFLWRFGMMGSSVMKKFSVPQPDLYLIHSWWLAVVPVGTGTGYSRISNSLFNQGGPIKSSQGEKIIDRKKIDSSVLTIPLQSYHSISFPMLSPIKYGPFNCFTITVQCESVFTVGTTGGGGEGLLTPVLIKTSSAHPYYFVFCF